MKKTAFVMAPGGLTLVCKESSSGACQFLVSPGKHADAVARYDVPSGGHKELDGLHAGTRVCAVVRPGAICTLQEAAVGR